MNVKGFVYVKGDVWKGKKLYSILAVIFYWGKE